MPHTTQPPSSISQILSTATPDPEWSTILEESPMPTGADWGTDVTVLKNLSQGMVPRLRAALDASKPPDITEQDVYVDIPGTELKSDGGRIRVLLCYRRPHSQRREMDDDEDDYEQQQQPASTPASTSTTAPNSPIFILFHGGGHTIGSPETELSFARLLVQRFNAVVVLPAYRLAPEHVFPSSFSDGLEVVKIVASDILQILMGSIKTTGARTRILPADGNLFGTTTTTTTAINGKGSDRVDFIIGGISAGATVAASVNHLYRSWRTEQTTTNRKTAAGSSLPLANPTSSIEVALPAITGLFLSCGSYINPSAIPLAYRPFYLSREQNREAPPLDEDMYKLFLNAAKLDFADPVWGGFDQKGAAVKVRERVGEDHAWMAAGERVDEGNGDGVRLYFQACGQDISRDDTLIFERVLREESGVETRLDIYEGFGHCFWSMGGKYPEMKMSLKRMSDSVEGLEWLLRRV